MMIKKALTKSGRRILKAIKNIGAARLAKKQQHLAEQLGQKQQAVQQEVQAKFRLVTAAPYELDSLSLGSLDAKSIDTFVTYVLSPELGGETCCCCCCCDERDENQRNENLENEMMR